MPVRILWPLRRPIPQPAKKKRGKNQALTPDANEYCRDLKLLPHGVTFVTHDHLRLVKDVLMRDADDILLVVDEVHKALNASQRTASALTLARRTREFVALTGTPIIDNKTFKLVWWLEQIVPFEVGEKNFWVAAGAMVSKRIALGIEVDKRVIEATFTKRESVVYRNTVSPALGGVNSSFSEREFRKAMELCYVACTRQMVRETIRLVRSEGEGVMLVAKDTSHQKALVDALTRVSEDTTQNSCRPLTGGRIFTITSDASINYTPSSSFSYDVVVTTMRHVEGYTLTALRHMVTCVYPSNHASREQLEGRLIRVGQPSSTVFFHVVSVGVLDNILRSHEDARSLSEVLKSLATEVEAPVMT